MSHYLFVYKNNNGIQKSPSDLLAMHAQIKSFIQEALIVIISNRTSSLIFIAMTIYGAYHDYSEKLTQASFWPYKTYETLLQSQRSIIKLQPWNALGCWLLCTFCIHHWYRKHTSLFALLLEISPYSSHSELLCDEGKHPLVVSMR